MDQFQMNIAIGYMEFSVTKHPAHVIGPVGMEQQLNSYASVDYFTTKMRTVVIGLK